MRLFTGEFNKLPLQSSCTCQGTHELEKVFTPWGKVLTKAACCVGLCDTCQTRSSTGTYSIAVKSWLCLPGPAPRHQNVLPEGQQNLFVHSFQGVQRPGGALQQRA